MLVSIITPFKLAFVEEDKGFFMYLDILMDCIFFGDLILNFFMAYYDTN